MSAPLFKLAEPIGALEPSEISCRDSAALALTVVRDGVITGEGPTTRGRVHFSRALDAFDAAWCSGTPAVDLGLLEQKADFYFLGRGLVGVRALLDIAAMRRRPSGEYA